MAVDDHDTDRQPDGTSASSETSDESVMTSAIAYSIANLTCEALRYR